VVLLVCLSWGCEGGGGGGDDPSPDAAAPDAAVEAPTPDAAEAPADASVTPEPDAAAPAPPLPEVQGPALAEDINPDARIVEVNLNASKQRVRLADGATVEMYAYNGQVPGPMIHARQGDTIIVHFTNALDEDTTIHWHGLRIPADMDGSPRIQAPVRPGETFTYTFQAPDAGSYWYHPHVRANEQVEKGLYGPIVIRGEDEPAYDAERYLMLDDILLDDDQIAPFMSNHMEAMHGRTGNVLLTNGRAEPGPGAASQGQVERWRIVNTANARTMSLGISGATFRVVGTDGGLLATPYTIDRLEVPVGQRYDVEVSYGEAGRVSLRSYVLVLDENDDVVEAPFEVFGVDVTETGASPRAIEWPEIAPPPRRPVTETVELRFNGRQTARGLEWTINGQAHAHEPLFTFTQGETVRMRLVNEAGPEHPFHLHGQFFTVENGPALTTPQPGLKDTVLVPGQSTVVIRAILDNPGRWMAHCHILEHAELGMMSEFVVEPAP
jgi:FtsP/CotA-like multicopper oxidase with cupredoxin domain